MRLLLLPFLPLVILAESKTCTDSHPSCEDWVEYDKGTCQTTEYIRLSCRRSCKACRGNPDPRFDMSRLPKHLRPIAFLIGTWRSESGGKAIFPTIPKFTYGEEITFAIPSDGSVGTKGLNYTAFAWLHGTDNMLHGEMGYISVNPLNEHVALTTVMDNGFVTVEEGEVRDGYIRLNLIDIGRITFARDLPVHNLMREWTLVDSRTLESRVFMETLTHQMQEHTSVQYQKVYP